MKLKTFNYVPTFIWGDASYDLSSFCFVNQGVFC